MTEITRVPLQPLAKGSMIKLWLGIAIAMLVAVGIAWGSMPAAVRVQTLVKGTGPSPTISDVALINYKGTLPDGKVFDQQQRAVLPLEGVVPGFTKALEQMQRGGKYKVLIPASLGYGNTQWGRSRPIPTSISRSSCSTSAAAPRSNNSSARCSRCNRCRRARVGRGFQARLDRVLRARRGRVLRARRGRARVRASRSRHHQPEHLDDRRL